MNNKHTSCDWELQPGEIWVGNTGGTEIPEHWKCLKTMRIGKQAYDIHGKPLDVNFYRPLIMKKVEEPEYDRIYLSRMANVSRR